MCYYEVIPSTDIVDHKIKWNVFKKKKKKSATGYITSKSGNSGWRGVLWM